MKNTAEPLNAPSLQSIHNRGAVHLLSVFSSVCFTILIVALVGLIPVNTDVSPYKDVLMPNIFKHLAPEPLEMPQYALTVVLLPCLYLIANALFKRIPAEKQRLNLSLVFGLDLLLLLATVIVGVYQVEDMLNFNLTFLPLAMLLAVFILIACFAVDRPYQKFSGETFGRLAFFLIFAATLILGFFLVHRVNRMLQENTNSIHHFYAWWYPVYKVGSGMTIGVDFNCLYGFYPYFVVPFLKLLGGVNQQSFSLCIAVVLSLISVCYFAFSYRFVKNKLLAGIAACAASFYGPLVSDYLAWHPSRTLFPAFVLGGVAIDSSLKSQKLKRAARILMALLLGLGIAWNIEMGFVAAISWAGYLIFTCAEANGLFHKKTLLTAGKAALLSLLSVAVAVAFIELITYSRSGRLIGSDSILFGQTVFAGTGFFMVKITFDTWVFVALPIAAGLFAALPYITKNRSVVALPEGQASALFCVSIIAIGSFSYFIGRSVPSNSLAFLVYNAMICGLLAELYRSRVAFAKESGCSFKLYWLERVKIYLSVLVIALIVLWAVVNVLSSFGGQYYEEHLKRGPYSEAIYTTAQNVKDWSEQNGLSETPHLLIDHSCFISEALNRPSDETVCEQIDWFYRENAHTYIDFLQEHTKDSFVIDAKARESLESLYPEDFGEVLKSFSFSQTITVRITDEESIQLYAFLPVE